VKIIERGDTLRPILYEFSCAFFCVFKRFYSMLKLQEHTLIASTYNTLSCHKNTDQIVLIFGNIYYATLHSWKYTLFQQQTCTYTPSLDQYTMYLCY